MRPSYLLLIAGLSFACGKIDKSETTQTPIAGSSNSGMSTIPPAMLVADTAALPACGASNLGQLVYVQSQAVFATCAAAGWTKVDVAGAATTGGSGISGALYCFMSVSKADLTAAGLDSAPEGGLDLSYNVTQFANNTIYVQARVSSGTTSSTSGIFWSSKQKGFTTARSDDITFDMNGVKDFGSFTFLADATVSGDPANPYAAVYSDPSLAQGKLLVFKTNECSKVAF
ncbi:MAG: hypothetical protein H7249_13650 [Chitinophagaceae bacterium]|nr:hypothetical protein [Oligoflexus sp.]